LGALALFAGPGAALASGPAPLAPAAEPCSRAWIAQGRGSPASLATMPMAAPERAAGRLGSPASALGLDVAASPAQIVFPNDPWFRSYQRSSLLEMRAPEAWDTSYGGSDVTIAIISAGVDYRHPDLANKIWRNADELPDNGLDDDANGYVDDVIGWNFPAHTNDPDDFADGLRGTIMAGLAAAETNNGIGIAGVSWGARIMPLKTLTPYQGPDGSGVIGGSAEDITEAVCYAANNGARVILIGAILKDPDKVPEALGRMAAAVEYAHRQNAVVVAPAGDCALKKDWCPDPALYGENPDILPANIPRVIGVQSYGPGHQVRDRASHGPWVTVTAPGEDFYATAHVPPGEDPYIFLGARQAAVSDYAAANVAGVIATMLSVNPDYTPYRVELKLCQEAVQEFGGPFDQPGACDKQRNDAWGYGGVQFEHVVERMPWKVRVSPERVSWLTDGSKPWPQHVVENPFLNESKWTLTPQCQWLPSDQLRQTIGKHSEALVRADLDALQNTTGPLMSGQRRTCQVVASPVGSLFDEDPAGQATITFEIVRVEKVHRAFLPMALFQVSAGLPAAAAR